MLRRQPSVFLLWGQHCDELSACTFVTVLRRAGVRVKVVGLSGRRIRGLYGLSIVPDITLHEALPQAAQGQAVIIPCAAADLLRFDRDPRLMAWLREVRTHAASLLLASPLDAALLITLGLLGEGEDDSEVCAYPPGEALLPFAQEWVQTLISKGGRAAER
jgi:putative intracellular protease/amidase